MAKCMCAWLHHPLKLLPNVLLPCTNSNQSGWFHVETYMHVLGSWFANTAAAKVAINDWWSQEVICNFVVDYNTSKYLVPLMLTIANGPGKFFGHTFNLEFSLDQLFFRIIANNWSLWNLRLLYLILASNQPCIELIICSACLSVWSFYPHCALILGDVLATVQQSTWINVKWRCPREFILLLLWSSGELTSCGNFLSSFHCANANYSRYYETFICVQLHKFMGVFQVDIFKSISNQHVGIKLTIISISINTGVIQATEKFNNTANIRKCHYRNSFHYSQ